MDLEVEMNTGAAVAVVACALSVCSVVAFIVKKRRNI